MSGVFFGKMPDGFRRKRRYAQNELKKRGCFVLGAWHSSAHGLELGKMMPLLLMARTRASAMRKKTVTTSVWAGNHSHRDHFLPVASVSSAALTLESVAELSDGVARIDLMFPQSDAIVSAGEQSFGIVFARKHAVHLSPLSENSVKCTVRTGYFQKMLYIICDSFFRGADRAGKWTGNADFSTATKPTNKDTTK